MEHFADRLLNAVHTKGTPACVGLDPVYARLPTDIRSAHGGDEADVGGACMAIMTYGRRVLEIVAPLVGVVKINVAFFEPYHGAGLDVYFELVRTAKELGLVVIGDVKRGDIGHSSAGYAAGQLAGAAAPDAVTVNAYFGSDGVKPFLEVARGENKGVFILVHTSNKSASQVQHLRLRDEGIVAERVAELVNEWAHHEGMMGSAGYSCVGAVVAPGEVERARALRALMPDCIFLVPGFGAQGRSVQQVAACFKQDGSGAIVNSSRGIIYAYEQPGDADSCGGAWEGCVEEACKGFVESLTAIRSCA